MDIPDFKPVNYPPVCLHQHQSIASNAPNPPPSPICDFFEFNPTKSPFSYPPGIGTLPGRGATYGNDTVTNNQPDLDWFNKEDYQRIVEDDVIQYVHKTAGRVLRKLTTTWEQIAESRAQEHPTETCFPFPNLAQWKLAQWLTTCKASQAKIDELLVMDGIFAETPCFRSASELFDMVENNINGFGGPKWFEQEIVLPEAPEDPLMLYLRNIEQAADYLAGRPDFAGNIDFEPQVIFELDDKTQIINQMPTGHHWHEILKAAGQHEDAALGGILFGSDVTHLTHYAGNVKVHTFYISLVNIHKEVQSRTSQWAWMNCDQRSPDLGTTSYGRDIY